MLTLLVLTLAVWAVVLSFLSPESESGKATVENASARLDLKDSATSDGLKPISEPAPVESPRDLKKLAAAKQETVKPTELAPEEMARPGAEALDVLVLGVDQRPEGSSVEGSRADTIMVARITPGTGKVKMLSIPRDMYVEIESGEKDRINAAYSYGGVEQMASAVENVTGIRVDRYAVVDFAGFEDIVDAVGGLKVEIQGEMPPGRNMEGTQTLDGGQALFYARYRGTAGGDLDRIARQQQLVAALRQKLISWGSVSKLPGIMEAVHGNLETDLGLMANISLARSLLNADDAGSAFTAFQLAGSPKTLDDGRQVLEPDSEANENILGKFLGEESN